jgi:hypothetical protein
MAGFFVETSAKISPDETIFQLQFNKSLFVSGEKIWFKNSLVSGHNNDHQNILFVDLCGEGVVISSRILMRENDHWQGDIVIPDSLETGIYLIRAYTGNFDGRCEMTSKLVTVINRFGNDQTNNNRKAILGNKPLDLIDRFPSENGNILKTYTKTNVYNSKQVIECWVEKEKAELPAGISYSVYKVPDSLFIDTLTLNPDIAEGLVEYANGKNTQIYNRLTLSGKVIGKLTKMPVSGERVLFSIPDSIPQINYATTDENGEFRFNIDDYYGEQNVVIQTLTKNEEYQIMLYSSHLVPPTKIPFYISDELEKSDFIKQAVQRALLQKSYQLEVEKIKTKPVFKYPFYGKASNIVFPERFVELNDFEEITKEILPLCSIRKQKNNYSLKISNQSVFGYFDSPLILVDGIPVFDIAKLIPLNSPKIKRVETQPQIRCYGDLLVEGVLSVFTTNGNFEDVPLPVNAVRMTFETIYQPTEYNGNYFIEDQNYADFRDVLYWKPMLDPFVDATKINVQCSYEKGSYIAVVQAIDKNGVVQRSVCRFKVE